MNEKLPQNQENISAEELLRKTLRVLEQISVEAEEEEGKEEWINLISSYSEHDREYVPRIYAKSNVFKNEE